MCTGIGVTGPLRHEGLRPRGSKAQARRIPKGLAPGFRVAPREESPAPSAERVQVRRCPLEQRWPPRVELSRTLEIPCRSRVRRLAGQWERYAGKESPTRLLPRGRALRSESFANGAHRSGSPG